MAAQDDLFDRAFDAALALGEVDSDESADGRFAARLAEFKLTLKAYAVEYHRLLDRARKRRSRKLRMPRRTL